MTIRESFEKWAKDNKQLCLPKRVWLEDFDCYQNWTVQSAWEAWQHQQSRIDELTRELEEIKGEE